MSEVTSEITENKLYKELTSGDSTLILSRLNEIDTLNNITPIILDILKQAYQNEKKLIIRFLIKKSLRLAIGKVKKIPLNVDLNLFESLLKDPNRIDDLALATYSVDTETAFSIAKKLRTANWQNFATEILPVFCRFFKHYGSFEDAETLLELTKHINSVVVISAIDALETIDSTKLQGIVESLLSSTSSDMRLKVIQVYYRWNKKDAMDKFSEMLFSENSKDKSLAIFHSEFFQFSDVEPLLIKVIPNINNKYDLINLMQVFVKNVYVDLPLKIFLANKHLEGEQQNLVKGLMLSIIRELNRKSLIKCSIQDYLAELKEKAKGVITEKVSDNTTQAQTDDSSDVIESPENKDELPVNGEIPFVLEIQEGSIPNLEDNNLKDFESLSEKKKIRFLSKINQEYFRQNYNRLKEYYNKSKDKILASFIVLFGKYGDKSEIDNIRQYCSSDNPDIICACIKALSRLDTDYLCLYLPKYLQNSNGKIRMTAVRICARINIEQVKNVLLDMITSENVNQRAIGVSTALLVDFSIVKEPLLLALEKEKNNDLIKSICDVLASNPDKDILYKIYKFSRTNKTVESKLMQEILETISEKLAVRLKQLQTSQQLIKDAETAFANETADKKIQNLSSSTNQQEIAVKAPQELNTYVKKDNMANTENTTEQKTAANNTKVYVKKENATNTQPLKTPSENKKVSVQLNTKKEIEKTTISRKTQIRETECNELATNSFSILYGINSIFGLAGGIGFFSIIHGVLLFVGIDKKEGTIELPRIYFPIYYAVRFIVGAREPIFFLKWGFILYVSGFIIQAICYFLDTDPDKEPGVTFKLLCSLFRKNSED